MACVEADEYCFCKWDLTFDGLYGKDPCLTQETDIASSNFSHTAYYLCMFLLQVLRYTRSLEDGSTMEYLPKSCYFLFLFLVCVSTRQELVIYSRL